MLPGEADPAQHLDAVLGAVDGGVESEDGGHRRRERSGIGVGHGPGRVPRRGPGLLDGHEHVGDLVLDGLELADGSPELFPHLGVGCGRVEAPAGQAGGLGGRQHGHELVDAALGEGKGLACLPLCEVVGAHDTLGGELAQHDHDAAAVDHAEAWRLAPEALILKAELVPVIVRAGHHVIHDEVRRDGPARPICCVVCHSFASAHGRRSKVDGSTDSKLSPSV